MYKKNIDVLIIGAGPAGLKCAEILGDSDLNVLVLEKRKKIGDKVCAGGVTGLVPEEMLPLKSKIKILKHHIFVNGKQTLISLKFPVSMIDRAVLGNFQLNRVSRFKNVEVQTGARVLKLNREYALTQNEKIYFQYLIGADGATSVVRRYLGLKECLYMGVQYIVPKSYDRCCWFFDPEELGSGYGWIFPHKGRTSAGVYFNHEAVKFGKAKDYLVSFLDKYGLDRSKADLETGLVNSRYCGMKFENIFLAGEAAGLVSPVTGEGISYALISGRDVGKHILNPGYDFADTNRLLKYKKRQERALNIFDRQHLLLQKLESMIFVKLLMIEQFRRYFEGVA
jgi:geranylgeranyl reductase